MDSTESEESICYGWNDNKDTDWFEEYLMTRRRHEEKPLLDDNAWIMRIKMEVGSIPIHVERPTASVMEHKLRDIHKLALEEARREREYSQMLNRADKSLKMDLPPKMESLDFLEKAIIHGTSESNVSAQELFGRMRKYINKGNVPRNSDFFYPKSARNQNSPQRSPIPNRSSPLPPIS